MKKQKSAHAHTLDKLATMPPVSHWPDRDQPFDPNHSNLLHWIADTFETTIDTATKIKEYAASHKAILFDHHAKLWAGKALFEHRLIQTPV